VGAASSKGGACSLAAVASTIARARAAVATSPRLSRWIDAGRDLLLGTDAPVENIPAGSVELEPLEPVSSPRSRSWLTVLVAVGGFAGAGMIGFSAPVWRLAEPTWRLTLPFIPQPGSTMVSAFYFVGGLILLGLSWLGLIVRAGQGPSARRLTTVGVVVAIWCVPFLLSPPLLSNDVYSYVAQGEMASQGIDPTAVGPVTIGRSDWLRQVDPVWRASPAPYGPVAIGVSQAVVEVTGHDPAASVWVWRGVAVAGVAVAAVGISMIARHNRINPAVAVAIGIGNPLVTLYLIGGIHNDALMFGFLALGLAYALRGRRGLAIVLLTAATAVKLPAVVALIFLGWTWRSDAARVRERVLPTLGVLAAAVALIAAACVAVGIGAGWITALESTGKVTTTFSPSTKIGYSVGELLLWIGQPVGPSAVAGGWRLFGLAVTALLGLVMLLRSPRVGIVRATGVMLVAYVLLGPVLWPWYLPVGFALLAAVGLGRYTPSYLIVCIAVSWFVWPTSVIPVDYLTEYQHLLGFGVVILVTGLAFGAQRLATRWELHHHHSPAAEVADRPREPAAVG
jgi:alpha-1,6-mannosyltransferase